MAAVDIGRWIGGAAAVAIGAGATAANWRVLVRYARRREHNSLVPLVGGCLLALGFVLPPLPFLRAWWWAPLVVDLGCLPILVGTAVWHLWRLASQ